jgi:hypothetical protein
MRLEVQDQPEFETWIGDGQLDAIRLGPPTGFTETRMVHRLLNIKYAPELIDFILLFGSPVASRNCQRDKRSRHIAAMADLDPEIDSRHVSHGRLLLERLKVLWFRFFSLAEDNDCLARTTNCHRPFQGPWRGLSSSPGHQSSPETRPSTLRSFT